MLAKKTGEFSKGKLMVKNCMDSIFDTGPFQSGVGAIWKGRLTGHFFFARREEFFKVDYRVVVRQAHQPPDDDMFFVKKSTF